MTAPLATSKLSATAALLVLAQAVGGAAVDAGRVTLVLGTVVVASMVLGNVMALRQDDATRLLAWSTVAQAGWVVLPVAALRDSGSRASTAYVLVYALATLVAFAAVAVVGARPLARFRGLLRRDPLVGGALVLAAGVAVVLLDPSETGVADAPAGVGSTGR